MRLEDLDAVVNVHLLAFQTFFLSSLGPSFLRELYTGILEDSSGIAYVFDQNQKILGFISGTGQPSSFYRRLLLRRWWRFLLASISPVIRFPSFIPRLLRALTSPHQFQAPENSGIIMSIAVLPDVQGNGIGKSLMNVFLDEAYRRHLGKITLTTDKHNNENANTFYRNVAEPACESAKFPKKRGLKPLTSAEHERIFVWFIDLSEEGQKNWSELPIENGP